MEAVAAHVPFLVELVGHGIEVGVGRHGGVERIVEHGDLRHIGHEVVHGAYAAQVSGVVDGCQVAEALDAVFHFFGDDAAFLEEVAALHDAVAYGVDFVEAFDGSVFVAEQGLEHKVHAFLVVGHVVHEHFLLAVGQSEFQECLVEADALNAALGEHALIVHVVEFVLD